MTTTGQYPISALTSWPIGAVHVARLLSLLGIDPKHVPPRLDLRQICGVVVLLDSRGGTVVGQTRHVDAVLSDLGIATVDLSV